MTAARNAPWDQRLAAILVRPLASTPVTPNMVTTAGLLLGLSAALLFASGHAAWGGVVFVIAAFLDHIDGELARRLGKTSTFGHFYDHIVAGINYTATFLSIGVYLSASEKLPWAMPLSLAAGMSIAATLALRNLAEVRISREFTHQSRVAGFEAEDILYVIGPLAVFDQLEVFLVLAAAGTPMYLAWTVGNYLRSKRA